MTMRALDLFPSRGRPRPSRERKPPLPREQQWHIDLVRTIREKHLLSHGWRMTHFPAGGQRTKKAGAILKAMGLERGWPDLLVCRPRGLEHSVGLMHGLELKRRGEELTDAQEEVQAWFLANGWPYAWVDRIEDAWAVLWSWGALRLRVVSS